MYGLLLSLTVVGDWSEEQYTECLTETMHTLRQHWIDRHVVEPDEDMFRSLWRLEWDQNIAIEREGLYTPTTPPAVARHTVPDLDVARNNLHWQREYRKFLDHLEGVLADHQIEQIALIKEDLLRRELVWGKIADVNGWYHRIGRRGVMDELRQMVGDKAFYEGRWPDPLPPPAYNSNWEVVRDTDVYGP